MKEFTATLTPGMPVPGPPGPPGAITPWTEDVDAAGFTLQNAGSIYCQKLYIGGAVPGQYVSTIVPAANAVALVPGAPANAVTITLPAGQWFLSAEAWVAVASGTPTVARIAAALTDTSGTLPSGPSDVSGLNAREPEQSKNVGSQAGDILPITGVFVNLSSPASYYLVVQVNWTGGGSMVAYGKISGRVYPA